MNAKVEVPIAPVLKSQVVLDVVVTGQEMARRRVRAAMPVFRLACLIAGIGFNVQIHNREEHR